MSIIGISSLHDTPNRKGSGVLHTLRTPHLRSVGIQIDNDNGTHLTIYLLTHLTIYSPTHLGGRTTSVFTPQEEEEILRYSRDPDIYEKIARSIGTYSLT